MSEFIAQGGYGFFVWGAYGMAAAVLLGEVIQLRLRQRAIWARLLRLGRLSQTKGHRDQIGSNDSGTSRLEAGQTGAN